MTWLIILFLVYYQVIDKQISAFPAACQAVDTNGHNSAHNRQKW